MKAIRHFFTHSTLYILESNTRGFSTLRLCGKLSAWYGIQIGTMAFIIVHNKEAV